MVTLLNWFPFRVAILTFPRSKFQRETVFSGNLIYALTSMNYLFLITDLSHLNFLKLARVKRDNIFCGIRKYCFCLSNGYSSVSVTYCYELKRNLFNTQEECAKVSQALCRFNLYLNEIASSFNNILSDPFVLPNGMELNSLLSVVDLIYLSRSKVGLQNCLNTLSSYCNQNNYFPQVQKKMRL